jgi:hypothetical protein
MEIALQRRDAGEQVVYCNLREGLPACEDASPLHRLVDLPETRIRRARDVLEREGIRWLSADYTAEALAVASRDAAAMIDSCRDLGDLKRLSHREFFDLGWGVLSSVVSVTKNSLVELDSHRALMRRYVEASILAFDRACELIDELRPDEVMLFNGRFATTRAVMRAAEARGIPWRIHERGGDKDRFWITDCLPHDMELIQRKMQAQWRESDADAGHGFFQARRNRIERDWHSFTRAQQFGRLPPELQGEGDWIAFFTTSEDEMLSIGDRNENQRYPSQFEAIEAVAEAVARLPGTRLCIRVHPHTSQKARADRARWARLRLPGVVLIGPEDPTDTYALIERAKVVCTYGSTVGVEATYWGRPSLLFSRSYYDHLGVCEVANGAEHVLEFLRHPTTFPKELSLQYGAFWELLGQPYRYYEAENLHRGRICGVYLDDSPMVRGARRMLGPASRLFGWG